VICQGRVQEKRVVQMVYPNQENGTCIKSCNKRKYFSLLK